MAEAPLVVASAVILPESPTEQPPSPAGTLKRRQSSLSEDRFKRPRLSLDHNNEKPDTGRPPQSVIQDNRQLERRKSGQLEERKRGQRLFGALLGTLSQSSSSTAQKRRTDIEKKQQAKLKLQAEEQDEKKKQKLEALLVVRREEQRKYDKQSMQIRHSNILAQAHFLHTKAQPTLYYKPWELLPGDEDKIKSQVQEAEEKIEREAAEWDAENAAKNDEPPPTANEHSPGPKEENVGDMVGSAVHEEQPSSPKPSEDTNMNVVVAAIAATATSDAQSKTNEPPEAAKDQGDDGGEVVEGEEDTVIY